MGLLPLPSHVHYELLLQLLERQTLSALELGTEQYFQVQQMIIHLRKALSVQKQLEKSSHEVGLYVEHRWSLNAAPPTAHSTVGPSVSAGLHAISQPGGQAPLVNLPTDLTPQPTTPNPVPLNPA